MRRTAIGVHCRITPNGVVVPDAGYEGSFMQDGPYRGRCRFHYAPGLRGEPDEVRAYKSSTEDSALDTEAEISYFYFALRASWSYDDSDAPEVGFTTDTNYPMFESAVTGSVNVAQGLVGKRGFTDPPPLSANPFNRDPSLWTFDETSDIQVLTDFSGLVSTYTLNTLWFYRGALIPLPGQEIRDGAGLGTATPDHAGAVLTAGNWQVLWDVYSFDGTNYTFVETKTYGPFSVPSTADPADHTTWASVNPSESWAIELGVDDDVVFRNLRIEQVT